MCSFAAMVSLAFVLVLPFPAQASWPFLAASAALQIAYCLLLVRAYETGELGHVYPIARGTAPLLVTLGAAAIAGERASAATLAGIGLVCFGILGLSAFWDRRSWTASTAALMTGVMIAACTLVDGFGVRLSHQPWSYAAWLFVLSGAPMLPVYWVVRGRITAGLPIGETGRAMIAGVAANLAYALVLLALASGPMGPVAALRETSILFALAIGKIFLGERLTFKRAAAAATIAAGATILGTIQ